MEMVRIRVKFLPIAFEDFFSVDVLLKWER